VVIGCEHPAKLAAATEALTARLTDDNPYVRGRAAEALGLLARSETTDAAPVVDEVEPGEDEARSFVTERVQFARGDHDTEDCHEIGTLTSIRGETDEIVAAITSPDEGECPHCGLALPEGGPPMCPRCGAPY
jgi:HEAT repeat protein